MIWDAPKAKGVAFRSLTGYASWGSQSHGWRIAHGRERCAGSGNPRGSFI